MSVTGGILASTSQRFGVNVSIQQGHLAADSAHPAQQQQQRARSGEAAASKTVADVMSSSNIMDANPEGRLKSVDNTDSDNGTNGTGKEGEGGDADHHGPSVDIYINNVVCSFSVRCHLNLRRIGQFGANVEYRREYGKVNMRFRNPPATATIWSSGKITITGSDSEFGAKKTARKCARVLQKMGFNVRFSRYKVVNVLGTCSMPFGIRIRNFSDHHPKAASYEPELHPAVTYKMYTPRATLKIFSTGSITVTAPAVENINAAIQHIYPLVEPHHMPLTQATIEKRLARKRKYEGLHHRGNKEAVVNDDEDEECTDEEFANEGAEDDDSDDLSSSDDDSI